MKKFLTSIFQNVSTMNPTVHGVEGVMEAYRICLCNTQLYGPTNFSPVISAVAQKAEHEQHGDRYQVKSLFLILKINF